jgi:cellulose synthase/poly-beta-1,6-N-acetylglucosamine synthase-like glycosyltransferase
MVYRSKNRQKLSAQHLLSDGQLVLMLVLAIGAFCAMAGSVFGFGWLPLFQVVIGLITLFYLTFLVLKFIVSMAASSHDKVAAFYDTLPVPQERELPYYTVLLMLVFEPEETVRQLVEAVRNIDYPPHKLRVMLVMEDHDTATRAIVDQMILPAHFEIISKPDEGPRTKPNAFNYAWRKAMDDPDLRTGKCVIYDAEDRMQVMQLKRAATIFRHLAGNLRHGRKLGCLQARLSFWNPRGSKQHRSNWVPTFSWAEYSVHFYRILPGLAKLDLVPSLGGTSNHFDMGALAEVARRKGPWLYTMPDGTIRVHEGPMDPYCVTEDALLAADLYRAGYYVDLFNSVTFEEAPQYATAATKQRERWNFGWIQSGLVQLRQPRLAMREMGPIRWFCYNLFVLGTPFSLVINPIMWALTATYFIAKAMGATTVTSYIQTLYPAPVFYTAILVTFLGNLVLWYQKLITPLRRQERSEAIPAETALHPLEKYQRSQEYGMVIRLFPTPPWWAFTSIAGWRALLKACRPSTWHVWGNTKHGNAADLESELLAGHAKQLTTGTTPSSEGLLADPQGLPEEA